MGARVENNEFKFIMRQIERKIVSPLVDSGVKTRSVSTRPGKLYTTDFGRSLGLLINSEDVFAVDYYGFYRKTIGFVLKSRRIADKEKQNHVTMEVPVVSFASIRVEDVLAHAPDLITIFPQFKFELLRLRGFKNK